jgi:TonB family protein
MANELAKPLVNSLATEAVYDWRLDSPWRRLPLTLPGALLVGMLGLWAGASFMPGAEQQPAEIPPLEAQLIEPPPPPPKAIEKPRRQPPPPRDEAQPEPPPAEAPKTPASLAAPPAPSAEEWQLASTYTLKNSKRYRNAWGQQVRSQMGTAVEGPDQGQVRFRITINPDGTLAQAEELWSTSAKATELARKAIQAMPRLPPTPNGQPLVFEQTISFLPYETGWPPSYKYDCLPDPPQFKNPFAWNGTGTQPPTPPTPRREERAEDCHPSDVEASWEEEESELQRQIERNRWGR